MFDIFSLQAPTYLYPYLRPIRIPSHGGHYLCVDIHTASLLRFTEIQFLCHPHCSRSFLSLRYSPSLVSYPETFSFGLARHNLDLQLDSQLHRREISCHQECWRHITSTLHQLEALRRFDWIWTRNNRLSALSSLSDLHSITQQFVRIFKTEVRLDA